VKPISGRNDAFGQVIWACYKGGPPFELVERDDCYIDAANSTEQYSAEWLELIS
jgi:predicted P-loop ATPase